MLNLSFQSPVGSGVRAPQIGGSHDENLFVWGVEGSTDESIQKLHLVEFFILIILGGGTPGSAQGSLLVELRVSGFTHVSHVQGKNMPCCIMVSLPRIFY